MTRRSLVAATAAVGIATLLQVPAASAVVVPTSVAQPQVAVQAAADCHLSVANRVAIGTVYTGLFAFIDGPCMYEGSLSQWDLYHPSRGKVNTLRFDGTSGEAWAVHSDHAIGVMTWRGVGSKDAAGNSLTQNSVTVTVKLAAGAWISSSRKADVVTLKGTSLLYSTGSGNYFKRSASGVFQFRERGTTTWKTLKAVTTNKAGEVTMAYRYSKTRDYRFALYSTPISWDLASATTTR